MRECFNMACHYHPERESTDICAICGKPICKECGLEIAGKIYCKDCLQKITPNLLKNHKLKMFTILKKKSYMILKNLLPKNTESLMILHTT